MKSDDSPMIETGRLMGIIIAARETVIEDQKDACQ